MHIWIIFASGFIGSAFLSAEYQPEEQVAWPVSVKRPVSASICGQERSKHDEVS